MQNLEDIAKRYYQHHEYLKALQAYRELIKQFPERDDLLITCANCYDVLNDKKTAIDFYKKAAGLNRKSVVALTNLATAYYEIGAYKEAENCCKKALKIDSENASAYINLGNIEYQKNSHEKALEYYQKAADIKPDYYIAEINLANTYHDMKKYQEAILHAQKSLKLDSYSQTAHTILGNSYFELEEFDKAVEAFLSALKLDSTDPWIYNSLSQAYQKKSLWKEALDCGWAAVEKGSDDDSHHINFGYMLYEAIMEHGDSTAKRYAKKWLQRFPNNPIVSHMANAVLDGTKMTAANDKYIKDIFDVFAPDFETVLTDLDYQAPTLIRGFLKEIYGEKPKSKLRILDAGCGTGLCAKFLKEYACWRGLDGVDLSEKMLEVAKSKKLYNKLISAELVSFLASKKKCYDLIVSADVFTYLGDLQKLFEAANGALKKNGRIIFTVTQNEVNEDDFFLHPSGRFLHRREYIEELLEKMNFSIEKISRERLRFEGEKEVMGFVVAAKKIKLIV